MTQTNRAIREGLMMGLIGSACAAVFYAAFDLLAARGMLFTVDMLGKAVFREMRDPAVLGLPSQLDLTAIALYSGLHIVLSLIIGLIVVGLVAQSRRQPAHAKMILITMLAGFVVTVVVVNMLTEPIRPLLPWWSVVVANAVAATVAGAYLVRKYPEVWRRLSPFGS